MKRVISVYLPNWPTERFIRKSRSAAPEPAAPNPAGPEPAAPDPEPTAAPLVLCLRVGNRREVYATDSVAQSLGLRVGMTVTKAQALVPGLVVKDAEQEEDAKALERLALWALQLYSPIAAADHPSGLVIDATGAAHLYGGEAAMLADIVRRLEAGGITAKAAMTDSWGASHAVARFGTKPIYVLPAGESAALLLRLPLAALRLPPDMVLGLRKLGFARIGDLEDKPRAPLTLRFGPQLHRRLDQAMCRLAETVEPARMPEVIETMQMFAEPIGAAETLARYTGKLVDALCLQLEANGLGARRLDLLFHRVDSELQAIRIGTSTPVRDAKRLTRLLCDKIETIDPGFGVEQMRLCATMVEPFETKQIRTSLLSEDSETDISAAIDVLSNRVGEDKLYRFTPVDSDVPERSFSRVAPMTKATGKGWPNHWPRPTRLLAPPEQIQTVALLPDHPPVSFSWRGIRRRVKRADGPERVFGEWWKRDAELSTVRDYFQVEDDAGERFWIYRAGDGEDAATGSHFWFIHGIFG
jgi:protein ImuB